MTARQAGTQPRSTQTVGIKVKATHTKSDHRDVEDVEAIWLWLWADLAISKHPLSNSFRMILGSSQHLPAACDGRISGPQV